MKKKLFLQVVAHLALLPAFSSLNIAVAGNGLLKNDAFVPYSSSLFSTLPTASPGGFNKISDKNVIVSGTVKDQEGNPLPGATILEKGTKNSVVSGANGAFSISVKEGAVLVVSFVGFETKEQKVISGKDIIITLGRQEITTTEIVVTALGIKKEKRKISYSTQEVKGEVLQKATEPNVVSNLIGKTAGLQIKAKTTLLENPEFELRGGNPVVVIDGVPANTDFRNISPDDIESVNVLKGTAASVLYGSLGKDGAIMITTKKGKSGANGVEVTFNSSNQLQAGYLKIPKVQTDYGMGYGGYYAFIDGYGAGGWQDNAGYVWGPKLNVVNTANPSGFEEYPQYNSPYDPNQLYEFKQAGYTDYSHYKPMPWVTKSKNNLKNFLRSEFLTTNNLSIAGKNDKGEYRISVSHLFQNGSVPNTHLNSTTVSVAGGLKISDRFRMDASVSYNKQYTPNYPTSGYGPSNMFYNILLWMGPDVDINDLKNYWKPGKEGVSQNTYNYSWYNNPWYLAKERLRGHDKDAITAQISSTYNFTNNLSLLVRTGATSNNTNANIKTPYSFIDYGVPYTSQGNYEVYSHADFRIVTDALLTYKNEITKDFSLTASAGVSSRYDKATSTDVLTDGLSVPGTYNLASSLGNLSAPSFYNWEREAQINSILGYAELGYRNAVFLNLSGRNDRTSKLQKPNNSYFYPAASLGIIVSELVKMPSFISFAKLRYAWASVSTDRILNSNRPSIFEEYATHAVYTQGTRWNGTPSLHLSNQLIQASILPNKTVSNEIGAEIRFLKNRLGIDFTYYNYLDKDYAVDAQVSAASGYTSQLVNGDKVIRKGIEIILTGTPVKTKNIQWNLTANYAHHREIRKEFYGGVTVRDGIEVGQRNDLIRTRIFDKSPDGQVVYDKNTGLPLQPGNRPVARIGYYKPDWEFGINNTIAYKKLSLSFQFDGRIGGIMLNGTEAKLWEGGSHLNSANSYRDDSYTGVASYVGNGVIATSGTAEYDVNGNKISDTRKFEVNDVKADYVSWVFANYVNDGDGYIKESLAYKRTFVKLREVILTYTLPNNILKHKFFTSASFSVVGRNLLMFTKVPYMDPDGYDYGTLAEPTHRNIGINLNLKF